MDYSLELMVNNIKKGEFVYNGIIEYFTPDKFRQLYYELDTILNKGHQSLGIVKNNRFEFVFDENFDIESTYYIMPIIESNSLYNRVTFYGATEKETLVNIFNEKVNF